MPLQSDEMKEQGGPSLMRDIIPALSNKIHRKLLVRIKGLWVEILAPDLSCINQHV